jgi:hypothetical protein
MVSIDEKYGGDSMKKIWEFVSIDYNMVELFGIDNNGKIIES